MSLITILLVAMAAGGVVAIVAGVQMQSAPADGDPEAYLRSLDSDEDETDEFAQRLQEPFITRVIRPLGARTAGSFTSLLPSNYRDELHVKLLHAGLAGQVRAEEIISAQFVLALIGVVGALLAAFALDLSGAQLLLVLLMLPFVGAALPSAWISRKSNERMVAIRKDLPDTLDLLAISVEAGMGFEGALSIVCEHFNSPLADEFSRSLKEMELGLPRRDALQNMKRRTNVPEFSNFVLAITQADALGMPLGRVLQTQATEMRSKRRQWARERAAKLPVKVLFPLTMFIFPAIMIVLMGPAMSEIGKLFA